MKRIATLEIGRGEAALPRREDARLSRRAAFLSLVAPVATMLAVCGCSEPLPPYPERTTVFYERMGGQTTAYQAELQFADYPTSVDSVAARVMAVHAHKAPGISGACTILYRIHSAHSSTPLADANADYGTMFAEGDGGCGPSARGWTWKRTLTIVAKPEQYTAQAEVVAGKAKAFGIVPLIAGAKFVGEESGAGNHVTRTYQLALPKAGIRDFYRKAMPAQGCVETVIMMDQAGGYECTNHTYDIGWESKDTLTITRWPKKN
jgi:hypothetical protein